VRTFNKVRLLIPVFLQRSLLLVLCIALNRQGSTSSLYNPENAWTDAGGALRADQEEIGQVVVCRNIPKSQSRARHGSLVRT